VSSIVPSNACIPEYVDPFDVGGTKCQQRDAAILTEWSTVYDHERIVRCRAHADGDIAGDLEDFHPWYTLEQIGDSLRGLLADLRAAQG